LSGCTGKLIILKYSKFQASFYMRKPFRTKTRTHIPKHIEALT